MNTPDDAIEFFYDLVSPYSYLANTQLDAIAQRTSRRIERRPFLLGAIMQATGNRPPGMLAAKARWMASDLALWAGLYGVELRLPAGFPVNTMTAQRALLAAEASAGPEALRTLSDALFRASWVHDRDIAQPSVVSEVADESGLDGGALLALAATAEIKAALKAASEEAVARGAFGAPTFFAGGRMFFGNDRIDLLVHTLTG